MARTTAKNGTTKARRQTRREDFRAWRMRAMHRADVRDALAHRADVAAMVDAVAAEIAARADRIAAARADRVAVLVDMIAAAMLAPAPVVAPPAVAFTTCHGERLTLAVGTRVVVGWSGGYRGDGGWRGPGAVHRTETVAALAADGSAVILTGGRYKRPDGTRCKPGEGTRFLPLHTADGSPTRQILGAV